MAQTAHAVIIGPSTADSDTLHLYHFDGDSSATSVPDSAGTLSLGTIGSTATPGVSGFSNFGNALDTSVVGSNSYAANMSNTMTTDWIGWGGAFTWEALITISP